MFASSALAQVQDATVVEQTLPVEAITISGNLLGTGLQNGLQKFAGSRTVMTASDIQGSGAVHYGAQNVGGIINFNTRPIPNEPLVGDATVRYNSFSHARSNQQYGAFIGGQNEDGVGMALLYSGSDGSGWRQHSDEYFNDVSLKLRYEISPYAELYGKVGYYDARADVPGGLSAAQYATDPFQSQRTHDFWRGRRGSIDI